MNLGTFTKHENGTISGTATTLLNSFDIEYRPIEEKVGNSPDFRLYRSGTDVEVGFARHEFGKKSGKAYLNTMIDTPELSKAIWGALVKEEDGSYQLKWSRSRPKKNGVSQNGSADTSSAGSF
ncbi:DUF736 family protein [uncultured Sneathiella sp.]|jgi:uncharacterized protein (DUF736 family)|uniref:DUF736 domain-containing protein n=1 Tax=uncultured Sneathiella sp. TaxID=879315 RepID=UPI0030EF3829|tara:strand:- start:442 stop:810 length:369 start_codon:yes stop_codon:yes gene_type:complete